MVGGLAKLNVIANPDYSGAIPCLNYANGDCFTGSQLQNDFRWVLQSTLVEDLKAEAQG